jgi:hypothetical protein
MLIGCAAATRHDQPVTTTRPSTLAQVPAAPTHAVPIDEPLPATDSDQLVVELRVIQSDSAMSDALSLPTTLPSDAMLLTRLRTCATLGKPFVSDATVQETSVRLTGTISLLPGDRYRVSLSFIERFGMNVRQLTTRVDVPSKSSTPHVVGGLMGRAGQQYLVLSIEKGGK